MPKTSLTVVRWNSWGEPIPASVLLCLSDVRPETRLYIESLPVAKKVEDLGAEQRNLKILDSLMSCRRIYSIKADVSYENASSTTRFKEVLISCPNLEVLHLRYPREEQSRTLPREGLDFGVETGEKLHHLKELVYECCSGSYTTEERKTIPSTFFDFTELRHLELRGKHMHGFIESL